MLISEIFHSLQGEGMLVGVPSVFVRVCGCPLRCRWCDSAYAWGDDGREMSVDELVAAVLAYPGRHVVLTGGEPMLAAGIHELAGRLRAAAWHVTIETSGTVPPGGIACSLASISPKLRNSQPATAAGGEQVPRLRPAVIAEWLERYETQLKFVVCQESDLAEVEAVLAEIGRPLAAERVLLMPEGVEASALAAKTPWLVAACLAGGYRYGSRLQVQLFGGRRGV